MLSFTYFGIRVSYELLLMWMDKSRSLWLTEQEQEAGRAEDLLAEGFGGIEIRGLQREVRQVGVKWMGCRFPADVFGRSWYVMI